MKKWQDLVLLNAVGVIDHRLPAFLKMHYNHKMKEEDRLMDFKSDIMVNIPKFLEKLDSEQSSSLNGKILKSMPIRPASL